jgi:hypothetical protein
MTLSFDFNNIMCSVNNNNNILKLQSYLEHSNFASKLVIEITHVMLVFPTSAIF